MFSKMLSYEEFNDGWETYARGQPFRQTESENWKNGWESCRVYLTRSTQNGQKNIPDALEQR